MASQACLASPVSSWPGLSEAWAADMENGARAAVKTKMDKRFILSYSVKLGWEVGGGFQGPSERIFRRPAGGVGLLQLGQGAAFGHQDFAFGHPCIFAVCNGSLFCKSGFCCTADDFNLVFQFS